MIVKTVKSTETNVLWIFAKETNLTWHSLHLSYKSAFKMNTAKIKLQIHQGALLYDK